jgi:hypothetical protein
VFTRTRAKISAKTYKSVTDHGEEVLSGRWRIISSILEKDEVQIAVSLSLSKMLMGKTKW